MRKGKTMRIINIFDEINEQTAKPILEQIIQYTVENEQLQMENSYISEEFKTNPEPIIVNICCPGGSAYHGFGIIDALKDSGSKIITKALGHVASMGLGVFLAGDTRLAGKNTKFLYHGCSGVVEGTAPQIAEYLREQNEINEQFKQFMYEQGCTIDDDILDRFLDNGTDFIFDYETAKKYNIVTE